MKILLFGGSFDPPHHGHRVVLQAALRRVRPDRACVIPSFGSPLKAGPRTEARCRWDMARKLFRPVISAHPEVRLDALELRRRRIGFTYQTLRHFRQKYPSAEIWFLLGSDAALGLRRWKRPKELYRLAHWLVAKRPEVPFPRMDCAPFALLPVRPPPWSSTEIRTRLLTGDDTRGMIPAGVRDYIRRRRLYGLKIHRKLRVVLPPKRYRHTLGVTRLAAALARRHGLDAEAAALAGLLHDCGRRFTPAQMVRYARRHRLRVPYRAAIERRAPLLLHAFISAHLARTSFGVKDDRVLGAVENHTLGRAGMPPLDRLLYVADAASEDRDFKEASVIRKLAMKNLGRAFRAAVEAKIRYVRSQGYWMHPGTRTLLRWAKRISP
ncbi:MAG: nicotinate (nicotinamide) nucleotide adenylyltransferase [Elusimicrobia bacterium]|nr:nicotinate (nicotinamide) nucleotide adenylyltransferase [Elusimicrobiota bacterium]